ncbi:MAG: hypothetical protein AB7E77_08290 [Desulfobulbus sp.]
MKFLAKSLTGNLPRVSVLSLLALIMIASPAGAVGNRPAEMLFNNADTNHDNLVSEAEYHAAMQRRFEQLDRNKDGNLSPQELENARSTARERFQSLRNGSGRLAN